MAGRSFTDGEEDPFEGLGPQEIQAYIDKALDGVSHSDPFEVRPTAVALDAMPIGMFFPGQCVHCEASKACMHPHFLSICIIVYLCSRCLACLHVTCNHDTKSGGR